MIASQLRWTSKSVLRLLGTKAGQGSERVKTTPLIEWVGFGLGWLVGEEATYYNGIHSSLRAVRKITTCNFHDNISPMITLATISRKAARGGYRTRLQASE